MSSFGAAISVDETGCDLRPKNCNAFEPVAAAADAAAAAAAAAALEGKPENTPEFADVEYSFSTSANLECHTRSSPALQFTR